MRRTILLADDSPTIRRLVRQTFAEGEFDVIEESNGDAAIRKFEEIHPSVVLADIYMPGRSGYEVCSYIREHAELSATPVVLLVGAFDAFDEETAKECGATASITKPFEPNALIDLVRSILPAEAGADPSAEPAAPLAAETAAADLPAATAAEAATGAVKSEDSDLLGLETIFGEEPVAAQPGPPAPVLMEEDIEKIADRVIQKVSAHVVESIAWDIIPDIAAKVVREELARSAQSEAIRSKLNES